MLQSHYTVLGVLLTINGDFFKQELELLPTKEIQQNIYIKHPVSIEQYLMEGSYNKVPFCKLFGYQELFVFSCMFWCVQCKTCIRH